VPGESIEKVLMGRFPGVLVERNGSGISVRIRGAASFYANTEPLYVIDGAPVESGPGGALRGLDPYDIATIQVLKNPSDIGVYGVRGANGVIVITTKGGH
jgi:TonB-dependent SusC/RagA subfamily outer membrane receptor